MLDENPVLDTNDVCRNPVYRRTKARESPVEDHEILLGDDHSRFIFQCWWNALYEIKESIATRFCVSAMLDAIGRPIALSSYVVTLIEQSIERLKDKRFVSCNL